MIRFAVMMRGNVSGIGWHDRRRSGSNRSESLKSVGFSLHVTSNPLKRLAP